MVQFAVFKDFRVQRGHAVGAVGKVNIHVSHMDYIVGVNDGCGRVIGLGTGQLIQLFDDGHQLGHYLLQVVFRPFFQSLRQNRVIGVGTGFCDDLHGFFEVNLLITQQPDQLRNHHGGVGVIDLDGGIVVQVVKIAAPLQAFLQNQLSPGADHQILLIDPKKAAGVVAVVWVKEQSQVLFNVGLVKLDAVPDNGLVNGVQVEQVQIIGAAFIACDGNLVEPCGVVLSCQGHRICFIGFPCPVMSAQPEVGSLVLEIVREILVEEPAVVSEADAVAGEI